MLANKFLLYKKHFWQKREKYKIKKNYESLSEFWTI